MESKIAFQKNFFSVIFITVPENATVYSFLCVVLRIRYPEVDPKSFPHVMSHISSLMLPLQHVTEVPRMKSNKVLLGEV